MNMNVDFANKEPLPVSTVAAASQDMIASAQVSRSAVVMAEQALMEDTYENQKDSSSDRKDPLTPQPRSLQISVSKETGLQIKVINPDTKEVVREIPPEELQRSMASIRRVSGMLFDKKA